MTLEDTIGTLELLKSEVERDTQVLAENRYHFDQNLKDYQILDIFVQANFDYHLDIIYLKLCHLLALQFLLDFYFSLHSPSPVVGFQ